jgi:DNA-directed RNA polymerase subunit RPC12/RpoP
MRAMEGNEGYNALLQVKVSDTVYKCHLCNKRFSRQEDIRSHYEIHAADFDFKCQLCEDFVQSNLQIIVNHLMEKHPEILKIEQIKEIVKTKYLCELCGFETDNAIPMFKHKIESHKENSRADSTSCYDIK